MDRIIKIKIYILAILMISSCGKDESIVLLPESGLMNGGFEYGDLSGWEYHGDARVVQLLDTLMPFEGNYMALLSTGMQQFLSHGFISQTFRVKEKHTYLSFRWNMIFEEFVDQMTLQPLDFFRVSIVREDGSEQMLVMLNAQIIGAQFNALPQPPGNMLPASPSIFPKAYMTGWQEATIDVSNYQGQEITIQFDVIGRENSEYRIGVMLDRIWMEK